MVWLWLVLGLVVLTAGAEVLVRGAVGLAAAMRISPLVIGLTVVAFGTSTPELVVSMRSAFSGQAEIALGNVVGSNIFNVLVILGLAALIVPLRVSGQLVRFDVPLLIGLSIAVYGMCLDGRLDRLEGGLLAAGLVAYTVWTVRKSRQESDPAVLGEYATEFSEKAPSTPRRLVLEIVLVVDGSPVILTPIEFKLLDLLARRNQSVQSRDQLLKEVWGYRHGVESRTLDTHIKRLRHKLGTAGKHLETVRGVGYRLNLAGPPQLQ